MRIGRIRLLLSIVSSGVFRRTPLCMSEYGSCGLTAPVSLGACRKHLHALCRCSVELNSMVSAVVAVVAEHLAVPLVPLAVWLARRPLLPLPVAVPLPRHPAFSAGCLPVLHPLFVATESPHQHSFVDRCRLLHWHRRLHASDQYGFAGWQHYCSRNQAGNGLRRFCLSTWSWHR
ncbi:MAG: hypothetical protein ACFWT0_05905 [Bifidobacterium crudilactis]